MTSLMAADLAESNPSIATLDGLHLSEIRRSRTAVTCQSPGAPSTYILADDQSLISSDVDRWIQGYPVSNIENTGVQGSRVPLIQRSTLATSSSLEANGIWYMLALILPLFSYNNNWQQWRCTPSTVLHTAEILLNHLARFCGQIRTSVRRLAHDTLARELFATAMDIVLVVYALGFLVLSLYQATMIE